VLKLLELKLLKSGKGINLILIEEPFYRLKNLNLWKLKEWRLLETEEEEKLKEEHFNIELQKTKDTEAL